MKEILLTEKDMVFLVLLYFHGHMNDHMKSTRERKSRRFYLECWGKRLK